ncbi:MAG: hypothetical protein CMA72_04285 [Euryarchaeota archaeon]|nr:hypothetical protein [Euryarchaeota archaeon]
MIFPVMSRFITWVGYIGIMNASRVSSTNPCAVSTLTFPLLFLEFTILLGSKNKIKNALVKIMVKIIFHIFVLKLTNI